MLIAQIIGNIGRDAEVKIINGKDYISFSVASTEKENGEDVTRWVSVLGRINNKNYAQYLKKGQQVFVSGCYSDKMYTHQNGVGIDRQIFAGTIQLCGKKEETPVPAASPTGQTNQAPYGSTVAGSSAGNPVPSYQTVAAQPQQDPLPSLEEQNPDQDLPF